MVIEHIYDMVTMLLNTSRRGFIKRSSRIIAIKQAMHNYFNEQVEIYRKTGVITAPVRKFVITAEVPLEEGAGPLPDNFVQDVTGETNDGMELTIVKQEEWADRLNSTILAPDQENPVAKIEDGKIFIEPHEFEHIKLTYFRKPNDFIYAVTVAGDGRSESFNEGASTDIEFDIEYSSEIIRRALMYLGVPQQNPELISLALNGNDTGAAS